MVSNINMYTHSRGDGGYRGFVFVGSEKMHDYWSNGRMAQGMLLSITVVLK
jgi:hypothetical protein